MSDNERSNTSPDPWPAEPDGEVDDLEPESDEGAKVTGGAKNANSGEGWQTTRLET